MWVIPGGTEREREKAARVPPLPGRTSVQFSLIVAEGTLRAEEEGSGIRLLSRLKLPFEELLVMGPGLNLFSLIPQREGGERLEFKSKASLPFMAFGALAGLLSGLVSAKLGSSSPALLLFLLFFFLAYKFTPSLLKLPPSQFPDGGWSAIRALKLGIWSFLACWLLVWILVYNLAL